MSVAAAEEHEALVLRNLSLKFLLKDGSLLPAVRDVSLSLTRGEVVAVVGESGSGKSAMALAMLRLHPSKTIVAGEIQLDGVNILTLGDADMRKLRGRRISMIFQDPMTSLNPMLRVRDQLAEAISAHESLSKKALEDKVIALLSLVRVPEPAVRSRQFPHQLSGGLRQRVAIAMGLASGPDFLLADEPTTALDVSVQARILELLSELNRKLGMGLMLISHDLPMVSQIADRVVVMYAGQIVESGPTTEILRNPRHPYTQALLGSLPSANMKPKQLLKAIPGTVPDLRDLPQGCAFSGRCSSERPNCTLAPALVEFQGGRTLRCWNA